MKSRSRGMLVLAIGVVWAGLQCSAMAFSHSFPALTQISLSYGLLTGLLLAASNLLLLESLKHIDISLGSTIYRLNTIGVVLLSVLLLNEGLQLAQWSGIALGIIAVLMLYHKTDTPVLPAFILLVVCASLLRALYGVFSKQALLAGADANLMILITALCWIIGGGLYAAIREKRFIMTRKKIHYALLSGILVFLIVQCLLLAIGEGQASIVIPVANMSFILALLISVSLGMERITVRKCLATGIAAGSIVLLSLAH